MNREKEKVIIFGGVGFIGTNLAISALRQGAHVVIFDNFSRNGSHSNLKFIEENSNGRLQVYQKDVKDLKEVEAFFIKHNDATRIFHLAGQVAVTTSLKNPLLDFESNVIGTFNILETMRKLDVKIPLLYSSTNKVYGSQSSIPIKEFPTRYEYGSLPSGTPETFPLDFQSPYGCSKGASDQYVLDYSRCYGIKSIVFRQSCIYGYYQFGIEDQGWVAWFVISSILNKPLTIFGNGKQLRDILFIDDLIDAYWMATDQIGKTNNQAYNIGGGSNRISLIELISELELKLEKKLLVNFTDSRVGDQKVFVCDTQKAKADFGWSPQISTRQGIDLLFRWVQSNGILFN